MHQKEISTHQTKTFRIKRHVHSFLFGFLTGAILLLLFICIYVFFFERTYATRIYPQVSIDDISFGGVEPEIVEAYFLSKNIPFEESTFIFSFEDRIATISGSELSMGYDATLSARQAYDVGRSGHIMSDMFTRYLRSSIPLTSVFSIDTDKLQQLLLPLSDSIQIPEQNALFTFSNNRVTEFRPSKPGRKLNIDATIALLSKQLSTIPNTQERTFHLPLQVETIYPTVSTESINNLGIKELIGRGFSTYFGSIPSRVFNIQHAAAKIHGQLIAPGETFSFSKAIGDISSATGYQQAFIIKDGRTILGDGGGVCQVSTTLFRAALQAGLPITERHPHAYRVGYYEQQNVKAGLDAAVFVPSVDLKFTNNTPGYILIQTFPIPQEFSLAFELYGTNDGRISEISNHFVSGAIPPPEPLYQDDSTIPSGTIKQIEHAAWGAKAQFHYKVTKNNEVITEDTFVSSYRPWQAVFLRGTL